MRPFGLPARNQCPFVRISIIARDARAACESISLEKNPPASRLSDWTILRVGVVPSALLFLFNIVARGGSKHRGCVPVLLEAMRDLSLRSI